MTEAEWLAAARASDLIYFLRHSEQGPALETRGRKYRLFAVACVRRTQGADERTVEIAERMADGRATKAELAEARARASGAARKVLLRSGRMAANDVSWPLGSDPVVAALLRDIFGNPFRNVVLDAAWLTPTVAQLAQAAYDERQLPSGELDSSRLAVLADALEEVGCADAELLGHLRGPGPHVRGCFAIDAILGKS